MPVCVMKTNGTASSGFGCMNVLPNARPMILVCQLSSRSFTPGVTSTYAGGVTRWDSGCTCFKNSLHIPDEQLSAQTNWEECPAECSDHRCIKCENGRGICRDLRV